MYGGLDGSAFHDCLYLLDTESRKWRQLSSCGPMRKAGSEMIAYGKKLVIFGGYGIPSGPTQPGAQFIEDLTETDGRGWTNEIHIFDLEEGVCMCVECLWYCCLVLFFVAHMHTDTHMRIDYYNAHTGMCAHTCMHMRMQTVEPSLSLLACCLGSFETD